MDRCALFVDAGYALADGALAVHGTRNRDSVSWDYEGLLKLLSGLSQDRTGVPLLRCYWYDCAAGGERSSEHDALADLPSIKVRVSKVRPNRKEGVEAEIRRDLSVLARHRAVSDVVIVSAEEDLGAVIAEIQDLGIRAVLIQIAADGNAAVARSLRQECDDTIELSALQLRPFVDLIAGAEPSAGSGQHAAVGYRDSGPAFREPAAAQYRDPAGGYRDLPGAGSREPVGDREQQPGATFRDPAGTYRDQAAPSFGDPNAAAFGEMPRAFRENAAGANGRANGPHQATPGAQQYPAHGAPDYPQQAGQPHASGIGPGRDQRDPLAAQDPSRFSGPAEAPAHPSAAHGSGQGAVGQGAVGQGAVGQGAVGQGAVGQGAVGQNGFTAPPDRGGHRGRADHHAGGQGTTDGARGRGGFPAPAAAEGAAGQNGVNGGGAHSNLQMFPGYGADGAVSQNGSQGASGVPGNGRRPNRALGQDPLGQDPLGQDPLGQNPLGQDPLARGPLGQNPLGQNPLGQDPLARGPLGQNPLGQHSSPSQQPGLPMSQEPGSRGMHAAAAGPGTQPAGMQMNGVPLAGPPQGGLPAAEAQRSLPPQRQLPPASGMPYPPDGGPQYGQAQPAPYAAPPGSPDYHLAPYPGSAAPAVPAAPVPAVTFSVGDAVQSAHAEGYGFGEVVARDAPALWLEAVLARKPRMPSDLEARLLQGSALPIDALLHDEVRHALRRGFWDALEHSRH